jgi:hypothetical protein
VRERSRLADTSPVPASTGSGVRRLTILDGPMSARYAAVVAAVAPAIEAGLGGEVVANRVAEAAVRPPLLRLELWRQARIRFSIAASALSPTAGAMLVADVRSFYPSIGDAVIRRALEGMGCSGSDVRAVSAFLRGLHPSGVTGLPVGPEPSAVLANAVLAEADDAVRRSGARHVRWVDDFWIFAANRDCASAAAAALRGALGSAGLALSAAKTRLIGRPFEIAEFIASGRVSVEAGRYHRPSDADPLPGIHGPHPFVPTQGGVGPGGRTARAAGGLG